jgi:phospholipase D1/2
MLPAWRVHPQTRSGILIDARDYYCAFYRLAKRARRSILLLGWQFDSDVPLVRGKDVPPGVDPESVELLPFLDALCAANSDLDVRMLAWDYAIWFVLEREVLQKLSFALRTQPNFHFENDATVSQWGAHHQKLAIIDGQVAFLGSADICQDRWDTSAHACVNPERVSRSGNPCKPYHEVQAVVSGAAARSLVDIFIEPWVDRTGEALDPKDLVVPSGDERIPCEVTYPMPVADVAIHRQFPHRLGRRAVREISDLIVEWIRSAEQLLYFETQYFTSKVIRDALIERMRAPERSKLQIVFMLPQKPEALKEELAVGATQAEVLDEIARVAAETGHDVGVYNVAEKMPVYIHSKVMIVDDHRLTLGSANLNNRSMSLDSELNVSWSGSAVAEAIKGLRIRLLREHIALDVPPWFLDANGLVARLDAMAKKSESRLQFHDLTPEEPSVLMKLGQSIASAYGDPEHSPDSRPSPLPFDAPAPRR